MKRNPFTFAVTQRDRALALVGTATKTLGINAIDRLRSLCCARAAVGRLVDSSLFFYHRQASDAHEWASLCNRAATWLRRPPTLFDN